MLKKIFIVVFLILILIFYWLLQTKDQIYLLKSGDNISQIAEDLKQKGIIRSANFMIMMTKILTIVPQTGYYQIGHNLYHLLNKFHVGKIKTDNITLVPGQTSQEYYQQLKNNRYIKTSKTYLQIMQSLNIPKPYEGRFLAQTYQYNYGDSANSIFRRSYNLMQNTMRKIWHINVENKFIKSPYQLIILASLIEKESPNIAEKAKIAGVFINRLAKNMRLQTDVSVIYALGEKYTGKLNKKDLKINHPYNTYIHKGLPPGAIANVGISALLAANNPTKHNLLYFVAKNNKEHLFSETYQQHKKNIKAKSHTQSKKIPIKH